MRARPVQAQPEFTIREPARAMKFYRLFLARAEAYYESNIRGRKRIESVEKRLAELTAGQTE